MDDFPPAAELAPVAFDVAGDPMSCHGQTSDQFASAERRQNQVALGSGFASLLKHWKVRQSLTTTATFEML